jgi:hypothetical protein
MEMRLTRKTKEYFSNAREQSAQQDATPTVFPPASAAFL